MAWTARHPGRALTVVLPVLLAIQLIGMFAALLTAAVETGDYAGILDPTLERFGDPKDSIPPIGPAALWNPLLWIFGIPHSLVVLIPPLPFLGVLLGVLSLAAAGGRSVRAALWTAVFVGLTVLTYSSYGDVLHAWLID
ncbi:hypothetical protein MB27_07930 [Actinoplanes utahensis]|uniref:Uncharacterized protein n=1 Tax=Actinoplanes utahensis TaxID=1869 RepID=A0A0A6URG1_ACTUT|nr:hypothetical protein MB27_07930 [Actinoplanes utahensis]GIF30025.1 hypothetical protein Aut01nite_30110 [Actinoplanes utahensis]